MIAPHRSSRESRQKAVTGTWAEVRTVQIVDVSEERGQKIKVACSIKLVDQREVT